MRPDPNDPAPDGAGARAGARLAQLRSALPRWAPGLHTLLHYQRGWLAKDLAAGAVLSTLLIPVGMGYAEASGVPAIHGLYATILPLLAYAIFGPSRTLVLGPDSTLAAVIAALILPLAAGSVERAVALAGALALLTAGFQMLIGIARLGIVADLFSKPIRLGFLNAIALTVMVGQLPRLAGVASTPGELASKAAGFVEQVAAGRTNLVALAIGAGCLVAILFLKAWRPSWPGLLMAVATVTLLSALLDLEQRAGLAVLGPMPHGLPLPQLPLIELADLESLIVGAAVIALLTFADTSVLSRSLAARDRVRVSQDQEMLAIGASNLATGVFQGFPVSSSASRTGVADAAGSCSQMTGIVGAVLISLLLIVAPELLRDVPVPALAAVVIAACLSFADVRGMLALWQMRRPEFALSLISFLGVAFLGVVEGIGIAVLLALLLLIWNAWHPYSPELVRVDRRKGWHDAARHPEGRHVPGVLIFRWDAPLFFANAEVFRSRVLEAIERSGRPLSWVVVAADAITLVDITASESLAELERELRERGIELHFAGLKGRVRDSLLPLGLGRVFPAQHFWPTVSAAVDEYRRRYPVDWKDWNERPGGDA